MRGDVALVVGVTPQLLLGKDPLTVDLHLEDPARRGDEIHPKRLTELVEYRLRRAHGTAGVVSGPAEFDGDGSHGPTRVPGLH